MSNFHRPSDTLDEHSATPPENYPVGASESHAGAATGEDQRDEDAGADEFYADRHYAEPEPHPSIGAKMSEFRGRIARALTSFDRGYVQPPSTGAGHEGGYVPGEGDETQAFDVLNDVPDRPGPAGSFPVGPLGYNRAAVDEHVAALERELQELRSQREAPELPISITEEIERLGEQTASILVVAHDKAHETTRLAQENADRCIADAARNAVALTEEAKRQLKALDMETDTVWQERVRLLDDARTVGAALIALIDEAEARFPEELKAADTEARFPEELKAADSERGSEAR